MAKAESILDLPVSFGGVSFGDKTARVGVTVERQHLKIGQADKSLCDKRLTGTIRSKPSDDDGQGRFDGMDDELKVNGTFDVKGFRVASNEISFGLTFAIKDLDRATLSEFPKRSGRLLIRDVEEIPEEEKGDDDQEESDGDDAAEETGATSSGTPTDDDAWKSVKVRDGLKGLGKKVYEGIDKLLGEDATLGKLFDWKNGGTGDRWWTDIEGLGQAGATKIDDAIEAFWKQFRKGK
jgi:hypothetical protein